MSIANPENVLCTHPNQYPKFEIDVIPGTDWELEIRSEHVIYAYRWDDEEFTMQYILWPNGNDAIFTSRDDAIEACKQFEETKTK
jgi:hypothetical protein